MPKDEGFPEIEPLPAEYHDLFYEWSEKMGAYQAYYMLKAAIASCEMDRDPRAQTVETLSDDE